MAEPVSIYVHIPFCRRRCPYCDFYSNPCAGEPPEWYLRLLEEQCAHWAAALARAGRDVETFFLGGGTPSLLSAAQLRRLLSLLRGSFPSSPGTEFTVECNPESLDAEKTEAMVSCGVNRLSIGAQALDDATLSVLGRIHSAAQVPHAVAAARQAGVTNINLDLIFGCPQQSLPTWTRTLEAALELLPTHLSCYCLTIEPETPWGRLAREGALALPDEDLQAEMAIAAHEALAAAGFVHYEISNFALPGYQCRHNIRYWQAGDYVGLGLGATSSLGGVRWRALPQPRTRALAGEALSSRRRLSEQAMLALRTREGLPKGLLLALLGEGKAAAWRQYWRPLFACPSEEYNEQRIALSPRGMMLADEVAASLM
jgi:oxygen-independent coproporphyrinogen-3 oxidase